MKQKFFLELRVRRSRISRGVGYFQNPATREKVTASDARAGGLRREREDAEQVPPEGQEEAQERRLPARVAALDWGMNEGAVAEMQQSRRSEFRHAVPKEQPHRYPHTICKTDILQPTSIFQK